MAVAADMLKAIHAAQDLKSARRRASGGQRETRCDEDVQCGQNTARRRRIETRQSTRMEARAYIGFYNADQLIPRSAILAPWSMRKREDPKRRLAKRYLRIIAECSSGSSDRGPAKPNHPH